MLENTALHNRRHFLEKTGAIYIDEDEEFLNAEEWQEIERLCFESGLPYETVTVGDADEPNQVEVGRFVTDVEKPEKVNRAVSDRLLQIIEIPARMEPLSRLLGYERVYLRRAQVNHMHRGSFVGLHRDIDSNPDYEISVVLQLGRKFEGGEFVIRLPQGGETSITPDYRSTIISRCDYPHEVRKVTDGTRTSLVYFVATHDGPNRRQLKEKS
jgi:hypothetical protein